MNKGERVKQWADDLTESQMRPLLVELVFFAMAAEVVSISELAPYWSNSGEPLIECQKAFSDEEDEDE
jgi:hypothetical protein